MITKTEKAFLNELRKNSRSSILKIANNIGLTLSKAFRTHEKLSKNIIIKHTSIPNFNNTYRMMLVINSATHLPENNINNLYRTKDGFLAELMFQTFKEQYAFIESLQNKNIEFTYNDIVEDLKREELKL